jgi:hypothetical protein
MPNRKWFARGLRPLKRFMRKGSRRQNEEGIPYAYVIHDNTTMTQADIDALCKETQK